MKTADMAKSIALACEVIPRLREIELDAQKYFLSVLSGNLMIDLKTVDEDVEADLGADLNK